MSWVSVVRWSLFACIVCLLVVEVVALTNREPGDTITSVIRDAVHRWPIIAVGIGVVLGHLFWSTE